MEGPGCCIGHTIPLGLASGIVSPFLYPHQLPPSPCVRIAWAMAVILLAMVAISTCLLGNGQLRLDRRHTSRDNDDSLGFTLVFHIPLSSPQFISPTSSVLSSSGPPSSSLFSAISYFAFSWLFVCPFCVGSFSSVFPEVASSVLFLGPLRLYLFVFSSIGTTRR